MSISMKELLGHYNISDVEISIQHHLEELLLKLNKVRELYGKPMIITSGIRTQVDQSRINPKAPKSNHILGFAADVYCPDGDLRDFVLNNLPVMKEIGFWFEDFRYTPNWIHFAIRPPSSGKRIFKPINEPPPHPEIWDGVYDTTLDGFDVP